MDEIEVLTSLLRNSCPEDIIHVCDDTARRIRSQRNNDTERFSNIEQMANCFMSVLMSNNGNKYVLSSATNALVELFTTYPNLRHLCASKGVYFNIMKDIFPLHKESMDETDTHLLCCLKLCVALTIDCPENLQWCADAGTISVVFHSLKVASKNKETMLQCLKFMSSLISPVVLCQVKENVAKLQEVWCKQCLSMNNNMVPAATCMIAVMNRFLGQSPGIQLYGIKCLRSIFQYGASTLLDNGLIDSLIHTCLLHIDDTDILIEALLLLEESLHNASFEISSKSESLCDLVVDVTKHYLSIEDVLLRISYIVKTLIMDDAWFCTYLVTKNVASLMFQGLFLHSASHGNVLGKEPVVSLLAECLYLLLADSLSNARNDLLVNGCENGAVNEVLTLLYLGCDINCLTEDGRSPLTEACKRRNSAMVKHIMSFVVFLNEVCFMNIRLEHIPRCLHLLQKAGNKNNEIFPLLLWFLAYQNKNGVAEWSKLGVTTLIEGLLQQVFNILAREDNFDDSKNLPKPHCAKVANIIWKAGDALDYSCVDTNEEETRVNWEKRFSLFYRSKCLVQPFLLENFANENQSQEDMDGSFLCLRCSTSLTYRDVLRISFDEDTSLEERIHEQINSSCTCFVQFPPQYAPPIVLKEIQLSFNEISSLSTFEVFTDGSVAAVLATMEKLKLSNNNLRDFPLRVAEVFCNVREIFLTSNQFSQFPFKILEGCPNLKKLDLSDNSMKSTCSDDCHVGGKWQSCGLTASLGQSIPICSSQKSLANFPHNLEFLNISENQLEFIPCWLFRLLPNLSQCEMKQNCLKSLPNIGNDIYDERDLHLPNLTLFDASQNNLTRFDCGFLKHMPNLKHLDLSKNRIEYVDCDDSTAACTHIEYLDISGNALEKFPPVVQLMPELKVLNISKNRIAQLPDPSPWKAKRLAWLDVSGNQLKDLSFVAGLASAVSENSMKTLNVSNNLLCELPPELGNFTSLEVLDVSHNNLQSLPDELGRLLNIQKLCIHGNKLSLNLSLLEDKPQELRAFLYARLKKSVPHSRVKVMLLGHAGAGKTTMLQSLLKYKGFRFRSFSGGLFPFDKPEKHRPTLATVGVDVLEWPLQHKDKVFQVSAWDFGGQEDFYATHPCFLSERAMFIVVYDGSKGPKQLNTTRPWLTAIHARAPHCPVLLVATHADTVPRGGRDEAKRELDEELKALSKRKWFPKAAKSFGIQHELLDVREGSPDIPHLKAIIAKTLAESVVQGNPLVCEMVPYSYLQLEDALRKEATCRETFPVIRSELESDNRNCPESELESDDESSDSTALVVSFNEMVGLLQKSSDDRSTQFDSGSELMMAVKYLHQTGVLLHFSDPRSSLNDCFFLKPAWLCQLFAQVISVREHANYKRNPYIGENAILRKSQLTENLISSEMIPKTFVPRLFRLLENFEVVMWQGDDQYMVPSKLPIQSPDLNLPTRSSDLIVIRYFSMLYIPMGFWPRLITRLLSFASTLVVGCKSSAPSRNRPPSDTKAWRNGVYMEWSDCHENAFVLVQSGCSEFSRVSRTANLPVKSGLKSDEREGLEMVLPRNELGKVINGQFVDHFNNLIEEWYPGLLEQDMYGNPYIMQYSPCPVCASKTTDSPSVYIFCLNDVSDSLLSHSASGTKYKELLNLSYGIERSPDGDLLVVCPNHTDQPVPAADLAPDVILADYDPELHLIPSLLKFDPTPNNLLGEGGFGSVYRAFYKGVDVAVKTFYISSSESVVKMIRAELHVLAQHQHPSIIALTGFVPPAFYDSGLASLPILALEFAKMGSLGNLLTRMTRMEADARKSALPAVVRHRIMYEVADGLAFLHSQHIVYRDLKPDNVLLLSLDPQSATISKITDYGISTSASPSGIPSPCGSPGYSAPEVVSLKARGKQSSRDLFPYSVKCDIYSYGLLLHEVAVGRSPWIDYVCEERNSKAGEVTLLCQPDDVILEGITPSPIWLYEGAIPWPHAQELIWLCLKRNPDERPTAAHIVKVLDDISSCCLRLTEHLHDYPVDCFAVMRQCTTCRAGLHHDAGNPDTNAPNHECGNIMNSCDLNVFWKPSPGKTTDASARNIFKSRISASSCRVVEESVCATVDELEVTCMLTVPLCCDFESRQGLSYDADPNQSQHAIVCGTSEGHILCFFGSKSVTHPKLGASIACLHFHNPTDNSKKSLKPTFVLAGLADARIVCFSTNMLVGCVACKPAHVLHLRDIACCRPVLSMVSFASKVHAACGRFLVSFTLNDSGGPTICSMKTVSTHDEGGGSDICQLISGKNAVYARTRRNSAVFFWETDSAIRNRIVVNDRSGDQTKRQPNVTCLSVDHRHSSLWIGSSDGRVAIYAEPPNGHVIRAESTCLAVLHPFTGPVVRILLAPEPYSVCKRTPNLIFCVGCGQTSLLGYRESTTSVRIKHTSVGSDGDIPNDDIFQVPVQGRRTGIYLMAFDGGVAGINQSFNQAKLSRNQWKV